jgi:hypothetical protein
MEDWHLRVAENKSQTQKMKQRYRISLYYEIWKIFVCGMNSIIRKKFYSHSTFLNSKTADAPCEYALFRRLYEKFSQQQDVADNFYFSLSEKL